MPFWSTYLQTCLQALVEVWGSNPWPSVLHAAIMALYTVVFMAQIDHKCMWKYDWNTSCKIHKFIDTSNIHNHMASNVLYWSYWLMATAISFESGVRWCCNSAAVLAVHRLNGLVDVLLGLDCGSTALYTVLTISTVLIVTLIERCPEKSFKHRELQADFTTYTTLLLWRGFGALYIGCYHLKRLEKCGGGGGMSKLCDLLELSGKMSQSICVAVWWSWRQKEMQKERQ